MPNLIANSLKKSIVITDIKSEINKRIKPLFKLFFEKAQEIPLIKIKIEAPIVVKIEIKLSSFVVTDMKL